MYGGRRALVIGDLIINIHVYYMENKVTLIRPYNHRYLTRSRLKHPARLAARRNYPDSQRQKLRNYCKVQGVYSHSTAFISAYYRLILV
jgi:hypothetical protein